MLSALLWHNWRISNYDDSDHSAELVKKMENLKFGIIDIRINIPFTPMLKIYNKS
jgi:hypothetical protein